MIEFQVDDYDVDEFYEVIVKHFGVERYGYVVTPNADHIIRYCEDPTFRALYADAAFVLFDSRFLARWLVMTRDLAIRTCPGSDLTHKIFADGGVADDKVVLVGAGLEQARLLVARFALRGLVHIDVPMGFVHNTSELERVLCEIETASPFRYCFIAVGSPQQEILSRYLKRRGRAKGLALCVGASINFLTGLERRAPLWVRRLGLEWLFRLIQSPKRLASRYLIRGPKVFWLLSNMQFVLRRAERMTR